MDILKLWRAKRKLEKARYLLTKASWIIFAQKNQTYNDKQAQSNIDDTKAALDTAIIQIVYKQQALQKGE